MQNVIAFFVSLIAFAAIDFGWLSVMGDRLYRPVIGDLMASKVQILPAVLFYLIYWIGVTALATAPALKEASPGRAASTAAIMALVAYATYDLTNQATLKAWAWKLTIADLLWGVFATTTATLIGFFVARALIKS
ncbi:MAG: hypothetical protein BGN86_01745 [Caulobacterales bacterium 68-7]|nr:MAG: hypothetical protein BGN86_01745 [Caulobacterales bacterium 68-7]